MTDEFPYQFNATDTPKTIALKNYNYLNHKYKELFTTTTFKIFEHIRINCRQRDGRFNTNHRRFAETIGISVDVVKKHLHILCLVGLLKRVRIDNYWYNYWITSHYDQPKIELDNKEEIMKHIDQIDKNRARMDGVRATKKSLIQDNENLKIRIAELEQLNRDQQEIIVVLLVERNILLWGKGVIATTGGMLATGDGI
jgi:predicted DNA-binding transcriptional regulator